MKAFFASLIPAFVSLLVLTVLLGVLYPLFMFVVGQICFPHHANGGIYYYQNKQVIGSEWIAQPFTKSGYFHPRVSNAGDNGYDAANSSGSNLGPTSQKLADVLSSRAASYRSENNIDSDTPIPADAVMASGSGLDPHISLVNAKLQASRVASARNMCDKHMRQLIAQYTEWPTLGIFGEARVNVLKINLALDALSAN